MNVKQFATYALVSLLLVAGWELGVHWMKKAHPEWVFDAPPQTQPATTPDQNPSTTPSTSPQTQATTTSSGVDSPPASRPAGQLQAVAPAGMAPAVVPIELGSGTKNDANYAMLLTLS